jgi:hypothetical protein
MIELEDQSQSDRNFRRGHGENKQKHNLAIRLLPPGSGDHKREACCVQHHLERHEKKNEVTPYEKADHSQREEDCR